MKLTVEGEGFKFELVGHFADIWPEMFNLLWESETAFSQEEDTDWSEPAIQTLIESPDVLLYDIGKQLSDFKASLKDTDKNISDVTLSDFLAFMKEKCDDTNNGL